MVDIVLATFNGEKYLKEQIQSLLTQTYQNLRVLIRDDGSTDGTIEVIKTFVENYPDKVFFIQDDVYCGSAVKNFMQLLRYATSDYVMYCDQDDVWLPSKVEDTLAEMQNIERRIGKDKPILVFVDYEAVDENLVPLNENMKNNQIVKYQTDMNHLMVQNCVTGCLAMTNRTLNQLMGEYDNRILMHDWWAALIASGMGEICHLPKKELLYRQHGDNVVGAVNVKSFSYRLKKIRDKNTRNMKYLYRDQMEMYLERYEKVADNRMVNNIKNFLGIYDEKSKAKRVISLLKGRYLKSDFVRIAGQLWYI